VFDLDHTLVNSPLDLSQVAREMEAFARRSGVVLPEPELPWYGAEILDWFAGKRRSWKEI
jgi:hypothetical protein